MLSSHSSTRDASLNAGVIEAHHQILTWFLAQNTLSDKKITKTTGQTSTKGPVSLTCRGLSSIYLISTMKADFGM